MGRGQGARDTACEGVPGPRQGWVLWESGPTCQRPLFSQGRCQRGGGQDTHEEDTGQNEV